MGQFDFTSDITGPIKLHDHSARHENEGADEISLTGLSGDPADTINESLLTTQDDIIVRGASIAERLNITEQTVVGRLTGANITAVALGISDNNIAQIDGTSNAPANLDYAKFTTSGLEGRSYQELVNDISGVIKATDVEVSELSTATYDDAQDYINFFGDRTLMSGGAETARADAITGVNTGGAGSASFEISGDLTATYKEDDTITVNGSTANDGNYTCKADSTHSAGTTTITVDEAVSDGTVDGSIYGAVDIASLTAWCKATDSDTAVGKFFDYAGGITSILTDLTTNYIYLDYNAGTPQLVVVTSILTHGFKQNHIHLGTAYRSGATIHTHKEDNLGIGRMNIVDMYHLEKGDAERASGLITTGIGLALSISAGVLYEGLSRHTTSPFAMPNSGTADDTEANTLHDADGGFAATDVGKNIKNTTDTTYANVTAFVDSGQLTLDADIFVSGETYDLDTFSYWYYDGNLGTPAWVEVIGSTTIDNLQYNDVLTGLETLTANRYGVHWVYIDIDGDHIHIVYGPGDYTANEAEEAGVPASLPDIAVHYGVLLAKIVVQKSDTTLVISYPWTEAFTSSLATDHGSLAGLTDDDHAQYLLADGTRALAGAWDMGSQNLTNVNIDSGTIDGVTITSPNINEAVALSATASELNLLDLAGLTAGELLVATAATTATWQSTGVVLSAPDISGTVSAATTLTMPAFTAGGDISLGANKIITTNHLIKDISASYLGVRTAADNAYSSLRLATIFPNSVDFEGIHTGVLRAESLDESTVTFQAYDADGSADVQVGQMVSANDPYFGFGGSNEFKFYNSGVATFGAITLGGAITGGSQNVSGLGTLGCADLTTTGTTTIDTALTGIIRADLGVLSIDTTALLIANLENPPTENEANKAATSEWSFDHAALAAAHGAVSTATASKIVVRDAEGQAKFAAAAEAGDALIKGTRVTTAELPAMTDEKYWVGTGANVEERDVPAGAGWAVVSEVVVGTAVDYVDFTSLDINTDEFYVLFLNIVNDSGSTVGYRPHVEADYTDTNYYTQILWAISTTIDAVRVNYPQVGVATTGDGLLSTVFISRDPNGYFKFTAHSSRATGANTYLDLFCGSKVDTETNITSLRITATVADGIGVGSTLILCKPRS